MASFLKTHFGNRNLASSVKPRCGFRGNAPWGTRVLGALPPDVDELSEMVMELEPDRKGVPVLLRQYLNLGGQMLAFGVDDAFSGVLDGLVVVDLARVTRKLQERYMGKLGAEVFHSQHAEAVAL